MAISGLLNPQDPAFDFDHDQLHREMMYAMPNGSSFTALPYLLDPIQGRTTLADWWDTNHDKAHSDFASCWPAIYWPSTVAIADINLNTGPVQFWAFSNWNLHNLARSVLPTSA